MRRSVDLSRWTALTLAAALGCGGSSSHTADARSTGEPVAGPVVRVLSMPHRTPEERARDRYRHPAETLEFFGLRSGMTVMELWPGRGWYTRVLGPLLREHGTLILATPDPDGAPGFRREGARLLTAEVRAHPDVYGQPRPAVLDPPARIDLGPDGSVDVVLTFRNFHNWLRDGTDESVVVAAFRVLRPGGVFGVVDHRARPGTSRATMARSGYVTEEHVITRATEAGFELDARSDVNANPADTADYVEGVWALPPTLRAGPANRQRYLAIGESDRMTLRFVKPGG